MMGRTKRIEGKALTYYVSSEGKEGIKIFMDDMDRLYFINLLRQQKIRGNLKFYGYVLLPRKFSFIMETNTNNLANSMHRIRSDYANYFNRRHKRKEKLFKDRYTCYIIEKKKYLAKLSLFLHYIPKIDGGVKSLLQYKWSSLHGYINREKRESWIDYESILSMFNGESQNESLNYQKFIKKNLKKQIASPFENLKGNIILGSECFKKEIQKNQYLNNIEPKRNKDILTKKIIKLSIQSPSWSSLKFKRKTFNLTILTRNASIYFLKKYTDLSNQQISTYFRPLKKSSISQMSRRFNLAKEKNEIIKKISNNLERKIKRLFLIKHKMDKKDLTC